MQFEIKHRFNGNVLFTAELSAEYDGASYSVKLGAAVKMAIKARADLARADLAGADLADAYLAGADLADADLAYADLAGANLADADLARANLAGANFADANLAGAKRLHFQIPDGSLIGWKKVAGQVVQLRIPERARRTGTPMGRKCRAEMAEVVEIEGGGPVTSTPLNGQSLEYVEGAEVWPDKYCDDWRVECSHGIHFFLTRAEAEEW